MLLESNLAKNCMRYGELKFVCVKCFQSICIIHGLLDLNNVRSLFLVERRVEPYIPCQILEKFDESSSEHCRRRWPETLFRSSGSVLGFSVKRACILTVSCSNLCPCIYYFSFSSFLELKRSVSISASCPRAREFDTTPCVFHLIPLVFWAPLWPEIPGFDPFAWHLFYFLWALIWHYIPVFNSCLMHLPFSFSFSFSHGFQYGFHLFSSNSKNH